MTLPKAARDRLGVQPGDRVIVTISEAGVNVEKPASLDDIWQLTNSRVTWPGDAAADEVVGTAVAKTHRRPS
jgi:AbrB family looped-hinge helix DNA binding protein